MSAKGRDNCADKSGLVPSFTSDSLGLYITISCGSVSGRLYIDKLNESKRSPGKCVFVDGVWRTHSEFEILGGKKAKKWRQSLLRMGRPLSDYKLSSIAHKQSASAQASLSDVTPQSNNNGALSGSDNAVLSSQCGHNVAQSPESVLMSSRLSPCNTVTTGTNYPLLVDHVLSFIKAYRLDKTVKLTKYTWRLVCNQ